MPTDSKSRKIAISLLIAIGGALIYVLFAGVTDYMFLYPDQREFRRQLESNQTLPILFDAAQRLFDGERIGIEDQKNLTALGVSWWIPVNFDSQISAVEFEFGGADNHYGIIITRSDLLPPVPGFVEYWDKRVWYYSELPSRLRVRLSVSD